MNVEATTGSIPELTWIKSSYSGAEGGDCVEVAARSGAVHVRDSKDTARPPLSVQTGTWTAFIEFATL
ncbi:MAG: hypothetical protein QOC85_901, partial [Streptomyces sp.]|nr:hypothetical protein [Streptomyces sp.]